MRCQFTRAARGGQPGGSAPFAAQPPRAPPAAPQKTRQRAAKQASELLEDDSAEIKREQQGGESAEFKQVGGAGSWTEQRIARAMRGLLNSPRACPVP